MIGQFGWRLPVAVACLALVGMVRTAPAAAAANLLSNGSFEKEANGNPIGWESRRWAGEATLELTHQGHTGKQSAMITSDKGADFSSSNQRGR